jgi:hypothetical protein
MVVVMKEGRKGRGKQERSEEGSKGGYGLQVVAQLLWRRQFAASHKDGKLGPADASILTQGLGPRGLYQPKVHT